jgi:hypothetical protein
VVYTMWGIYHANYDIFHAIKVAKEVCMDWTTGPALDGGAHCCLALFRSVTFKFRSVTFRLNGTMQQQRWQCGLELKGQWLLTHGTVQIVFAAGTWSSVLMAVQIYHKFTSACVALAILKVRNKRINSRTSDCLPLITTIFPK